ncbi:MAG: GtrA family protein [Erythrobacter sp.]
MPAPAVIRAPARYLVIGLGCALLNNAILISADWAGLHYTAATVLTFVSTVPIAYFAHATWTFSAALSWHGFCRFVTGSMSSLMLAAAAVALARGAIGLPMVIAAPLATVAMTIYNYLMARWAVKVPQRG